jgi:hypothetical protein
MAATEPRFKVFIKGPANGRVRKSEVVFEDSEGKTRHSDRADMHAAAERERVIRKASAKLAAPPEELRAPLEDAWNETLDGHRRQAALAAAGSPEAAPPEPAASQPASASTRLVELALSCDARLTQTPEGQAHLTVTTENGRRETWPVRSRAARRWLQLVHYRAEHRSAGTQAVEDALGVLEGMALCEGSEEPVLVRVAGDAGCVYLDLADEQRSVIRIDRTGWRIVPEAPVLFRRPRGVLKLPVPQRGGSLGGLRRLVNVEDDAQWHLLVAWTLAALRPRGPYPVLCLNGQQGSAKSTVARMLRSLVDPSAAPLRSEPRDARDVMIAATNGWVVALDNLSAIQPWLSDCLCRLATGGGFGTRELYSDLEEVICDAQRPVILTSIEDLATRGDLLDRAVVLTLPPIPEDRCRPEAELWQEYDRARPLLLGALLDALAGALDRLPSVRQARLPRMADFALLGVAAEKALGWKAGSFMTAYGANRQDAHAIALEASPLVPPLLALAGGLSAEGWSGTAGDLLKALSAKAGETATKATDWPKTARALAGRLRRLAPNLRPSGVVVTFGREGPTGRRVIRVNREGTDGTDGTDGRAQPCSCEGHDEGEDSPGGFGKDVWTPFDDDPPQ